MVALLVESWIWYSVVLVVAFSRFISRRMTLGSFRKFQADDYLMAVILCFYTTLIATINIVRNTSSNLLPPGYDIKHLKPSDIREREYGSKLILVVEQCQCVTIWGVKGCLILLYLRITTIHRENIAIKILGAYVVVTFVVMDILYFGVWCQPFHEYWAVPTDSRQCNAATNHLITNAVFNLSSDVAMLLIVLPIFLRMKLPWRKKIPLILLFSLGIFTILAAILNKVYSFTDPFGALWTYWYTRESSTALLVANLPFVWTLWRKIPGVNALLGTSKNQSQMYEAGKEYAGDSPGVDGPNAWDAQKAGKAMELEGASGQESPRERRMTLAEILGEQNPASFTEKEPTPITHPQLFYGTRKPSSSGNPIRGTQDIPLSEMPDLEEPHPDSNGDEHVEGSFDSSTYPSVASKKSAGSLV